MFQFDLPKDQSSIIKVIGVGGGGSNAVNHMYSQNIQGVDFIICNTDAQAVKQSKVPNKIQLGPALTEGLGAGANPEIGRQATEESLEEIKAILQVNTKMAFITAGMGGGTGTGGAPILAKICHELGILTVGIVTTPFSFEGKKRKAQAEKGILELKEHVDTLLVISNDKVRHQYGNLKMTESFAKADNVLATAAKCITDVINSTGQINVDFADVSTVMTKGGVAILGSATAEGENRAQEAIEQALNSPLLNDNDIFGAKWILININSMAGEHEFTMDEVTIIQDYMLEKAGEETDVILGMGYDESLGSAISITLIATGFEHKDPFPKVKKEEVKEKKDEKIIMPLQMPENKPQAIIKKTEQPTLQFTDEKKAEEPAEKELLVTDAMMPRLTEEILEEETIKIAEIKKEEEPVFFEISSAADQTPVIEFEVFAEPVKPSKPVIEKQIEQQERPVFLAKPNQLFAEQTAQSAAEIKPEPKVTEKENSPALELNIPQDETEMYNMEMVIKEKPEPQIKNEPVTQDNPKLLDTNSGKPEPNSPLVEDDTEQLRIRAQQRIEKLRKLSFNLNSSDPNNEFETVPAYLRRNMEMHNQIADVENFYSNYTVNNDDNPQPEINTLNTFLEGKKPD